MSFISSLPTVETSKGTFFTRNFKQNAEIGIELYDETESFVISLHGININFEDPISIQEVKSLIENDEEI